MRCNCCGVVDHLYENCPALVTAVRRAKPMHGARRATGDFDPLDKSICRACQSRYRRELARAETSDTPAASKELG